MAYLTGKNFKRKIFAFVMIFVIMITNVSVLFTSASNTNSIAETSDNEIVTENRISEVVLSENDYNNALTGLDYYNYKLSSIEVCGVVDPLDKTGVNKVLRYSQAVAANGILYFNTNYNVQSADNLRANAIKAEPGTSYIIEYDYLTTGFPSYNMYIDLTAGDNDGNGNIVYDTNNAVNVHTFIGYNNDSKNATDMAMEKWSRNNKVAITLPKDFDSTSYPYLIFRCNGGGTRNGLEQSTAEGKAQIYFDNIKVTKLVSVSEELITYDTYENATIRTNGYEVPGALGTDSWPTTDPLDRSNKVIRYRQNVGTGLAIIGSSHSGSAKSIASEAITAVAGKTYNIEFDYYATGTTNVGTSIRFAVGDTAGHYPTVKNMSFEKEILKLNSNSNVSTNGWVRGYKATVTVPEDTDFNNGDKLLIKMTLGGHKTVFYIDNVKVTGERKENSVTSISKEQLTFNDYSTALKNANDYSGFYNYCGDIKPVYDPLDSANLVLQLSKFRTSNHQIILGAKYSSGNEVRDCTSTITPVAGESYEIQFDWYSPENPQGHDVIIYAASGPVTRGNFGSDYTNCPCYDFQTEIFRISSTNSLPSGWQTVTAKVTIPEDTVITEGNILLLYVRGDLINRTGNPCFDNIKVSKLPQISVEMNIGSEHSSNLYTDIKDATGKYPISDYKSVMWFTDKDHSVPFSVNSFDADMPTHITLYGVYEPADTAFVLGDLDSDSLTGASDLIYVRKYLLGITENYSSNERADINGDSRYDVRDLVRLKKAAANVAKDSFKINGNVGYTVVVPSDNFSQKNLNLVSKYIGEYVTDATNSTDCEIIIGNATRDGVTKIDSETNYQIAVNGNKLYVNGGSDKALAAAILALNGYMSAGFNLKEGCVLDFEYISVEHPADTVGIIPESIFLDDYETTKEAIILESGEIKNAAATISLANGSITDEAKALGDTFAAEINNNKVAEFQKGTDLMVHVSSFAIINDVIYMTYYANETTNDENPTYQNARFVYCHSDDVANKTYIDLQKPGDKCHGKTVNAIYDTILMQKDEDTLYLMWTANLSGNYYRLYRTYTISTDTLSQVYVNRFKVGDITNDFSVTGIKSALAENEIAYKDMYSDIGIMQKISSRVENGETYYYTGAYCGDFNCIIKSKDFVTWEYVAQPDFVNQSKWENATYVIGDKCYYFVRQSGSNYGFLTCYDLINTTWDTPVLIEDVQSRSDFIVYNNNLYLVHAPRNNDGIAERQHLGIVRIDKENLANSEVVLFAYMGDSCFYPFVQYANGDTETIYLSFTVWRKRIRLTKFSAANYLN